MAREEPSHMPTTTIPGWATPGWAELRNGEEPSMECVIPELIPSGERLVLARDQPEPPPPAIVPARSLAAEQFGEAEVPLVQTSSEATNMQKLGCGQAQLVVMPLE